MNSFQIIYTLLGGLGIFFYGMKQMSNALQETASDVITNVINSLTTNRFLAVLVGIIVTMIVQSSSVTTVMVVGFANAGLMGLTQAIGVIFGSNIGTTITGWIISIKVGKYGLLFIGAGIFPTLFAKNSKIKSIGKVLFGIGMVFYGLELMSGAFKPLRTNEEFINLVAYFSDPTYTSYLASVFMGCLLTVIIQSSSAMLGITIALASTGVIGFTTAAALVLGENIGTTITAILASVGTGINAKRAARAHAIFNILGVSLVFIFFPFYVEFVDWLVPGLADAVSSDGSKPNIATHIAASHTLFNVTATLAFLPFLNHLARLVTRLTPGSEADNKTKPKLVFVGDTNDILPATAIIQAESEVKKMVDIIDRMYSVSVEYLDKPDAKKLAKIHDYERVTDNIQKEVTVFLCKVMEKSLTSVQSLQCQTLIKIVDELESIADYIERIVEYRKRLKNLDSMASSAKDYRVFRKKVWHFYQESVQNFTEATIPDFDYQIKKSEELRILADDLRDTHLERVSAGEYEPLSALTYSDMVVALRKIRAHAYNITQALKLFYKHKDPK